MWEWSSFRSISADQKCSGKIVHPSRNIPTKAHATFHTKTFQPYKKWFFGGKIPQCVNNIYFWADQYGYLHHLTHEQAHFRRGRSWNFSVVLSFSAASTLLTFLLKLWPHQNYWTSRCGYVSWFPHFTTLSVKMGDIFQHAFSTKLSTFSSKRKST